MINFSTQIVPIVLCGGQGSRLWPLSRKNYPKQFLKLTSGGSLLQETVKRIMTLPQVTPPIIICNEDHYFLAHEQMQDIGIQPACIILEPIGKNTAPAITISAMQASQQFSDNPLLLIMPADHFIQDNTSFLQAVMTARLQTEERLFTFGIKPASAKTGYGYIKLGASINGDIRTVAQFTEKPDLATAQQYCVSGDYLWNSGMFLFHANTYLREMKQHAPTIFQACQHAFGEAVQDKSYLRLKLDSFSVCPEDSIDYAIMEKTAYAAVMPIDCGWADMGDWTTISEVNDGNEQGNVVKGDVFTEDVSNSCLFSNHRLIAAIGIHDQVIIETKDAVLVADKSRTQDVKRIVAQLQQLSHQAAETHNRVFRAWGYSEVLIESSNYVVKQVVIKPAAKLSLQMHLHRAEHWVVVNGIATVECDQRQFTLSNNESTYIPRGSKHRLSNMGTTPLHIIEVQTGDYLSEEDIVRFDSISELTPEILAS